MQLKSVTNHKIKRLGRGISAGGGKTAGRGTKGQKARSGFDLPTRYEGGQTPLSMRLPKLPGFKSHKSKATLLSLDEISKNFKDGEILNMESLLKKGLVKERTKVKILNNGSLTVKVSLGEDILASKSVVALFKNTQEKTEAPIKTKTENETKQASKVKPTTKKAVEQKNK
jgi:large subunit ribosomal protein L15